MTRAQVQALQLGKVLFDFPCWAVRLVNLDFP
jgi:hypothetical protein